MNLKETSKSSKEIHPEFFVTYFQLNKEQLKTA